MQEHGRDTTPTADAVLAALPAAVFVMDEVGTITWASPRAAAIVGREIDEVVGESVLAFVDAETSWAYAAAVAMAGDYPGVVMGPLRVAFASASGESRVADLWATNHLADPEISGIVCLLTEETTMVGLGEAIEALGGGAESSETSRRVVEAMRGHPVTADASVIARDPEAPRRLHLLAGTLPGIAVEHPGGPWHEVLTTGRRVVHEDLSSVPDDIATSARGAGYLTVWAEPIGPEGGPVAATLVVWRRTAGRPSPNELSAVHRGAAVLHLALGAGTD